MIVRGLSDALKVFNHYSEDKPKKIRHARRVEARKILNQAKTKAPKLTGKLRNSGTVDHTLDNSKISFGGDAEIGYAAYLEFGTGGNVSIPAGFEDLAIQFKGKGIKQINIKPQPYLIPAFLTGSENYKKEVERILQE
jgi:hypothetical protein